MAIPETHCTLQKVADTCRAEETAKKDDKSLTAKSIRKVQSRTRKNSFRHEKANVQIFKDCKFCGKDHKYGECPARGKACSKCKKLNHFAAKCYTKGDKGNATNYTVVVRNCRYKPTPMIQVTVMDLNKNWLGKHKFSIPDSGCEATLADMDFLSALNISCKELIRTDKSSKISGATGNVFTKLGSITLNLKYGDSIVQEELVIVKEKIGLLIRWEKCIELRILPEDYPAQMSRERWAKVRTVKEELSPWKLPENPTLEEIKFTRERIVEEFKDVLIDNNGPLKSMDCDPLKIELTEDAKPFRLSKARVIPFALREETKAEMEQMVRQGVIAPLGNKATDWCHPVVVVRKPNGGIRFTVDLTKLNKFVKRPIHPMVTPYDAVSDIPQGCKFFTTMDCIKGYWQIPLDESSQDLTTFITPWGRFKFLRWPMGLNATSDVFNWKMDQAFEGIQGCKKIVDDVLKFDEKFSTHVQKIREFLLRCREHGISINKKKFQFAKPEVEFVVYLVGQEGIKVDPGKVKAITNFPTPTNLTELRSFMGLVNHLGGFSEKVSEVSLPLRPLLSKKNEFVWLPEQEAAFQKVKEALVDTPVRANFNPNLETTLETDASKLKGFGYALRQKDSAGNWRLIEANSRWLSPAEENYSMTTLEMMSAYWATKKLNVYLQGLPRFTIITDHQAIVPIMNTKTLDEIENPRQREIKERMQTRYNFEFKWKPGQEMKVSDALSRNPCNNPAKEDLLEEEESFIVRVLSMKMNDEGDDEITDPNVEKLKIQAAQDSVYQKLRKQIKQGFPKNMKSLVECLREFWTLRNSLSIWEELVILDGRRIVIPKNARQEILVNLHLSHQGIVRTKQRARGAVYWPNIDRDIEVMIDKCEACQKLLPSQGKEEMYIGSGPTRPFQCVAVDLFTEGNRDFLAFVDRYSGWPALHAFNRKGVSASQLKQPMSTWFANYGIPERLESDEGPNLASHEFQTFLREWGVEWRHSSPHYPQSNGLAEAAVKKLKYMVKKVTDGGSYNQEAIDRGLLELRNTPRVDGLSPAKIVFGHELRSVIPVLPFIFKRREGEDKSQSGKKSQMECYNEGAKTLPKLRYGDQVRVQDHSSKHWNRCGTVEIVDKHRRYGVRMEHGRLWWRNRRFLRKKHINTSCDEAEGETESLEKKSVTFNAEPKAVWRPKRLIKSPMKLNL